MSVGAPAGDAVEQAGAGHVTALESVLQHPGPWSVAAILGLVLHESFARPLYSWSDRLAAWLLLVFLLAAARHYLKWKREAVPVLVLVAAQIYIFYGLSQFFIDGLDFAMNHYTPGPDVLSLTVWLVVLGEGALFAGYWLVVRWRGSRGNLFDALAPSPEPRWRGTVYAYTLPCLAVFTLMLLRPDFIPVTVRNSLAVIFDLKLAVVLLLYLGYRHHLRGCLRAGWALVLVMSAVGAIHGMLGEIVFPWFVAYMAAWVWGGRINVKGLGLLVAAVLVLNPVKNMYREIAWQDKDVSSWAKVDQRIGDWSRAFRQTWLERAANSRASNLQPTADRASDLLWFAQSVDFVPGLIPYNNGRGFETLLVFWVPRVLWHDKPSGTDLVNNAYALTFGITDEAGVRKFTMAISPFTEGYWNFGAAGTLGFLAVYGILLGLLLGRNGVRADASAVVALVYLAPSPLPIHSLSMAIPSAITFSVGTIVMLNALALAARLTGAPSEGAAMAAGDGSPADAPGAVDAS